MRRYDEPIAVHTNGDKQPVELCWRNRNFQVAQIDERWRWAGKWWLLGSPQHRHYFRVQVSLTARYTLPYRPRCIEIYRQGDSWVLSRIYD